MPRADVTAIFPNTAVQKAWLVVRKRPVKTGPPQDPPTDIPGQTHPMTGPVAVPGGVKFTAAGIPLPNSGAGQKLLLRVIGKNAAGTVQLAVLDGPARDFPRAAAAEKNEEKEQKTEKK